MLTDDQLERYVAEWFPVMGPPKEAIRALIREVWNDAYAKGMDRGAKTVICAVEQALQKP